MYWQTIFLPFTLNVLLAHLARAEEKPCTVHDGNKFYDLNPLKATNDYKVPTPGGRTMMLNVCRTITTETFGLKEDPNTIAGFFRRDHGDFSIGALNTNLSVQDSRPRLTFINGSPCNSKATDASTSERASTVIEFVCDRSVFSAGKPRLIAQLPPDDNAACAFVLEWRTHLACPTSEDAWGFFAILAVVILSLLVTYTVLGVLYNRFVLNLTGFDQIPQFSIESMRYHATAAFHWCLDLLEQCNSNIRNSRQRAALSSDRSPDSFSREAATPNPFSHQAQVGAIVGGGTADADRKAGGNGSSSSGGGFVRPQPSRSGIIPRGVTTNPISHQSQVNQAQLASARRPPSPPPPRILRQESPRQRTEPDVRGASTSQAEFMLGEEEEDEEDEEEGEEMGDLSNSKPPRHDDTPSSGLPSTDTQLRARGLGSEGAIRL